MAQIGTSIEAVIQLGSSTMRSIKALLPWLIIALGIAIMFYPRITGKPIFPVFLYDNPKTKEINELMNYSWWAVPFVYIFSYFTRAWGPLALAFTLGGVIATFINKDKMRRFMASKRLQSYIIAGGGSPIDDRLFMRNDPYFRWDPHIRCRSRACTDISTCCPCSQCTSLDFYSFYYFMEDNDFQIGKIPTIDLIVA